MDALNDIRYRGAESVSLSRLGLEQAKQVFAALQSEDNKVSSLALTASKVGEEGLKALATTLQHPNCNLKILELQECEVEDEGVKALAIALQHENCKLETLDLDDNNVDDAGLEALSLALKSENCRLNTLHLSSNAFDVNGVQALASALQSVNCTLMSLNLRGNSIEYEGAASLLAAIANPNCKLVDLAQGMIDDDIFDDFVEAKHYFVKRSARIGRKPIIGAILLFSGIAKNVRGRYSRILENNNLNTMESWQTMQPNILESSGVSADDSRRMIAAFQYLSSTSRSSLFERCNEMSVNYAEEDTDDEREYGDEDNGDETDEE